jgi:hypothetical protein
MPATEAADGPAATLQRRGQTPINCSIAVGARLRGLGCGLRPWVIRSNSRRATAEAPGADEHSVAALAPGPLHPAIVTAEVSPLLSR